MGQAQDLTGIWFGPSPEGLVQLAIDADSVHARLVTTNFRQTDGLAESFPLRQTVVLDDRQLLICRFKKDTTTFYAVTIFDVVAEQHFQQAWNASDIRMHNPGLLVQAHREDHRTLFGHYYFSARYIDALHRRKPIEEMTKPEFDQCYAAFLAKSRQSVQELELYEPNSGYHYASELGPYLFTLFIRTLHERGFNPLVDQPAVQELCQRFYSKKRLQKKLDGAFRS